MGARALKRLVEGFVDFGLAHNGDAAQNKAKTKQGPIIPETYLDWVETLQPRLWLEEPS